MMPSALVLVKNEEWWLPYVLTQLEGVVDSVVIYDVNSTDSTRDVIDWWTARQDGKMDLFVKYMPECPPIVQGSFRNSMIVEGRRSVYWIVDGDELYHPRDLTRIAGAAEYLQELNGEDPWLRYGVFSRTEITPDLRQRYIEQRGHHRLYTRDAFWTGTHPGEIAGYKQNDRSEFQFRTINCWHFHNALRSSKEEDALKRIKRKRQKTYHPGTETEPFTLLDELPILREPIEDFAVTPALAQLQKEYKDEQM